MGPESKGGDCVAWLPEVKTMTNQVPEKSEKRRNSRMTEMAEKMVIDALKMYAVARQSGYVQFVEALGIRSIIDNFFSKGRVAKQAHKTAARAAVHPVMIEAVTNTLLKNNQLMGPVAMFVSNYVEKKKNRSA